MVTYSCKAVHSNFKNGHNTSSHSHPFTFLVSIQSFLPQLLHFRHYVQRRWTESIYRKLFSCTTLAIDNYTGSKLKFGKKIQKYALVTLHYVSKSSSPSLYLILTGFGTSTALCLVVELFSPDSLVFLTTLGLEVPFLVDCGLVPFF